MRPSRTAPYPAHPAYNQGSFLIARSVARATVLARSTRPAMPAPSLPHDGLYKQLFSHAPMVEALLRGFVYEDWVRHADFATLEKANGQYVSEALLQRSDDVIWRIRLRRPEHRSEWLYLFLLIEFRRPGVG